MNDVSFTAGSGANLGRACAGISRLRGLLCQAAWPKWILLDLNLD